MYALAKAHETMEWKEDWRKKANDEVDQELHDHQVEMESLCRADAIAYAAIAQAEAAQAQAAQLKRIADALDQAVGGGVVL